eukprot:2089136-Pyramimonas_sp.AAC.1
MPACTTAPVYTSAPVCMQQNTTVAYRTLDGILVRKWSAGGFHRKQVFFRTWKGILMEKGAPLESTTPLAPS